MSYLYVCEQGAVIGYEGSRFQVKYKDDMLKSIPAETLEMIQVFGKIQLTTQCMEECLQRGIGVVFYSSYGSYFGRLISTNHVNVARQRMQAALTDEFKLEFSKNIIRAKIQNQVVILRRYERYRAYDATQEIEQMLRLCSKLPQCSTIEEIMGYEGAAARSYFSALGNLIDPDFYFEKRTRRPPLDPFNSMISLGYSVILNEIYGKLEGKGLNPYFGVLHQDHEKHPTLASDLMEEWRPVLVDSLALSLLNGHEIAAEEFYQEDYKPGVFLTKHGFKTYIAKLEEKFHTTSKYISYVDYDVSFRRAMDLQIQQLCYAIESGDPSLYMPVRIR
jgi:CRISP-associated protein Cas1